MALNDKPAVPIVLFGALRSGTTMFRLILDCHEALANPGETDFLLDHIRPDESHPTGWRYDREALLEDRIFLARGIAAPEGIDGLDLLAAMISGLQGTAPDKRLVLVFHRNAPKLNKLLPDAPILHLLRDPRDVARSSTGMGWSGNSFYGVRHWIRTETGWSHAAIPESRVHVVRFERLMQDIEGELRQVCDFLEVPYSDAMLKYPESTTYGPPDPRIAEQWRRKATTREIARIEAVARDMMTERGYAPEMPPHTLGAIELGWLFVTHRARRWRYNWARYGPWLFAGPHLARALQLRDLEKSLLRRQDEIKIRDAK